MPWLGRPRWHSSGRARWGRRPWAIEIKRGLSAKLERGFYHAHEDLKPDRYPIAERIEAIGLKELTAILSQLS